MGAGRFMLVGLSLFLLFGPWHGFSKLTLEMANAAAHAQKHDEISYGKFTRMLFVEPAHQGHRPKRREF
jgi:hypothetical protein